MTDTTARVAVRAYRGPGSSMIGTRALIHVNCACRIAATLTGTHSSAQDAEDDVRDMGYKVRYCSKSTHTASQETREAAPAPHVEAPPVAEKPAVVEAPAGEAPAGVEEVWEPGHCTPMMGGAVHEVTSGLDGSDGGPVHIFPLCRTGSMTNQGTRYRKVTAELTCKNCIGNRDRRRAAQARRAAATAVVEAPATEEAAPVEEAPAFVKGDRVVCADGMTRTVDRMKRYVADEPEYVVMECGALWIAANCQRANRDDVLAAHDRSKVAAARMTSNPDANDPEWCAALKELTTALDYLKVADPLVGAALAETDAKDAARRVHSVAHNFQSFYRPGEEAPAGWTFRTGYGARARYGVVTAAAAVAPIGLYEYATTAERAFHQAEKDAQADVPEVAEPAADQADELDEHEARRRVTGTWPSAKAFKAGHDEDGRLLGYTFQVGTLHGACYGWITTGGTFAKALEPYRSIAVALLPMATRDEQAARS